MDNFEQSTTSLPSLTRSEILSPSDDIFIVDEYVTSECILLCILCIVTRCLFRDVSIIYLSHVVMPRCSDRED